MKKVWANKAVQRKVENGFCMSCPDGVPAVIAGYCEMHHERYRMRRRERGRERVERGECYYCGRSPLATKMMCARCADGVRSRANAKRPKRRYSTARDRAGSAVAVDAERREFWKAAYLASLQGQRAAAGRNLGDGCSMTHRADVIHEGAKEDANLAVRALAELEQCAQVAQNGKEDLK